MDDRKRYPCSGGPYDREYLWLGTRATLVLSMQGWHGRYVTDKKNQYLIWEPK